MSDQELIAEAKEIIEAQAKAVLEAQVKADAEAEARAEAEVTAKAAIEEARGLSSYLEDASDSTVKRWLTKYHQNYEGIEKNWDARVAGSGMFDEDGNPQ